LTIHQELAQKSHVTQQQLSKIENVVTSNDDVILISGVIIPAGVGLPVYPKF